MSSGRLEWVWIEGRAHLTALECSAELEALITYMQM